MLHCEPTQASEIVTGAQEQIDAIAQMLSDADGRFTHIVDTFEWQSFTPEQRTQLMHWHSGCRQALFALRNPHVL